MRTNILPGAVAEVGLLCCACVHSNPEEAVSQLVEPILLSVISSLKGTPRTGFGGGTFDASASSKVPFFGQLVFLQQWGFSEKEKPSTTKSLLSQ